MSLDLVCLLQITAVGGAPMLRPIPSPAYRLHLIDANMALGNLLPIVRTHAPVALGRRG